MSPPRGVSFSAAERKRQRCLVAFFLWALLGAGARPVPAYVLNAQSVTGTAGREVTIPVVLQGGASPVAAVVFEVEYDPGKLEFTPATDRIGSFEFEAQSFATDSPQRIGIAVYDPEAPVRDLPDGTVIPLRFRVRPDATGFAAVRVSTTPGPDAANMLGNRVSDWNPSEALSGVFVTSVRSELLVSPAALSFGSVRAAEAPQRILMITNPGDIAIRLQSIRLEPEDARFTMGTQILDAVIAPQSTLTVPIRFDPSGAAGSYDARIVIEQSHPFAVTREVAISATIVNEGTFNYEDRFLIPLVECQAGADSESHSTLAVMNAGYSELSLIATFLPASGAREVRELRLASGESRYYSDVISEVFGLTDRAGALLIDSSSPDLVVRSALRTDTDGEFFSQPITTVEEADLLRFGQTAYLGPVERREDSSSKLYLQNVSEATAAIRVEVLRLGGTSTLVERVYSVGSWQTLTVNDLLETASPDDKLLIRVSAATEGASFYAFVASQDSRSGSRALAFPQ